MYLLEANIEFRTIRGISAMVLLFTSFMIGFIANNHKKSKYHKDLQAFNEREQKLLMEQMHCWKKVQKKGPQNY